MKKNTKIQALSMLLTLLLCASVFAACKGNEQEGAGETLGTDAPEQSTEAGENTTEAPETEANTEESTEESTEGTTEGTTEAGTTEPEPEKVAYAVTVIGSDGNARQGAVVRFYRGEEQVTMVATGADGTANAQLLPDTYTVVIDNILGEQYETVRLARCRRGDLCIFSCCGRLRGVSDGQNRRGRILREADRERYDLSVVRCIPWRCIPYFG